MTMQPPTPGPHQSGPAAAAVCSWHPDRATALTCSRCGRPACPECLTPASVGFHCRACVAEARAAQRTSAPRTIVGARTRTPAAGASRFQQAPVTYSLIALNVLVFLVVAVQAGSTSNFDSSSIFNGSLLVPMVVADGQWWRLVTSGFLHLSVTHIALNMLALYFIGIGLERVLGTWRYLALYLLSLLGGSASVMLFSGVTSASAGASGAIFGLMGALLVTLKRFKLNMGPAVAVVGLNFLIMLVIPLVKAFFPSVGAVIPGISWQAHLGGLVIGAIVAAGLVYAPAAKRFQWHVATCVGVGVVLVVILVAKDASLGEWHCFNTLASSMYCRSAS